MRFSVFPSVAASGRNGFIPTICHMQYSEEMFFQYLPYSPARPVMRINLRTPREEAPETIAPMPVQHIFK